MRKYLRLIWVTFIIILWAIFASIAIELEEYLDELEEKWRPYFLSL